MNRRQLLRHLGAMPILSWFAGLPAAFGAIAATAANTKALRRALPGDPAWPADAAWAQLNTAVGGRLVKLTSPLDACVGAPANAACADLFKE